MKLIWGIYIKLIWSLVPHTHEACQFLSILGLARKWSRSILGYLHRRKWYVDIIISRLLRSNVEKIDLQPNISHCWAKCHQQTSLLIFWQYNPSLNFIVKVVVTSVVLVLYSRLIEHEKIMINDDCLRHDTEYYETVMLYFCLWFCFFLSVVLSLLIWNPFLFLERIWNLINVIQQEISKAIVLTKTRSFSPVCISSRRCSKRRGVSFSDVLGTLCFEGFTATERDLKWPAHDNLDGVSFRRT